jgi:hypothetical protein
MALWTKGDVTRTYLQDVRVGDQIATGSIGTGFRIDSPVTVLEPNHALVMGTSAFVLEALPEPRTRLLAREPYPGWIRLIAPSRFGLLRVLGGAGSGGGRESNPPSAAKRCTGFEGMSRLQAPSKPLTSAFVFGRRPRTSKDL